MPPRKKPKSRAEHAAGWEFFPVGGIFSQGSARLAFGRSRLLAAALPLRYVLGPMSDVRQKIQEIIEQNRVVLFMKGTKTFPQCGFSQRAVQILKSTGAEFMDVNVLKDPDIRQGIKEFSSWPTIPQVYIDGKFVGGSDILIEMQQSGELAQLLTPKN